MNQLAAALLAPFALLLSGSAGWSGGSGDGPGGDRAGAVIDPVPGVDPLRPEWPRQVRIEQHFSIRISPGMPMELPPDVRMDLEQDDPSPRLEERPFGKCLAIPAIAAVQGGDGNRLLLFTRDQRIVMATLDKACRARDFYSGFYVERHADGMICVERDALQSRSGANCRVKRLRELVQVAPQHRFP